MQIFFILLFIHDSLLVNVHVLQILFDLICCFTIAPFFHADWHLVVVVKVTPASVDTNSLLAFISYFLAHTASSICQCQVVSACAPV